MVDTAPAVRRTLAVALLALVLLTAWLVLGMPGDGGPPGTPEEEVARPPTPVLREPVPQEPAPTEDEAEAEAPSEPSTVADEPADEPTVERRRAVDARTRVGSGRLRVRSLFGGVLWIGRGGSLPLDAAAAPAAAALAEGFVRRVGDSASGSWTVDDLAPGPLRVLVADAEGQRFVRDDLWLLADETLELEAFESPTAQLDLTVLGPDGRAVPFARVGLLGDRPGGARDALGFAAASLLGVTDGTGRARVCVPLGGWRLLVEGGGPTPEVDLGLAPYVLDGGSRIADGRRELTIERTPGAVLRGDLLDPDDLGFAQRRIAAWSPVGPGPTQREALALGLPVDALATVHVATVGADRRFVLAGLPAHSVLHLRALVESDLTHGDAFAPLTLARAGELGVEVTQRAGATLELDVVEVGGSSAIASFTAELPGTWPGRARTGRDGRLVWSDLRPHESA
ncbi:MAG TPA: hypothetical protein VMT18_13485, partial [Planctomycetota bacterium]|nr:hypothetical protein [Planctomycetota bacterium]